MQTGTWYAGVVRFVASLGSELLCADGVGPFVNSPGIEDWRSAPETPEDEEARLQAMLMFMTFM
jgi:hypothetical protein